MNATFTFTRLQTRSPFDTHVSVDIPHICALPLIAALARMFLLISFVHRGGIQIVLHTDFLNWFDIFFWYFCLDTRDTFGGTSVIAIVHTHPSEHIFYSWIHSFQYIAMLCTSYLYTESNTSRELVQITPSMSDQGGGCSQDTFAILVA